MASENATHKRRIVSAKEHLAGIKAGQAWAQEVVDNHLQHLSAIYDAAVPQVVEQPQEVAS